MYDQLKTLEKTILDIKKQYQLVSAELSRLKQQPSTDPKTLTTLKTQLNNSITECDKHKKQLTELDSRYQSLAEAHHMMGAEQDNLQKQLAEVQQYNQQLEQQNQQLEQQNNHIKQSNSDTEQQISDIKQQNHDLKEKNRVATEHIQVVFQRLTRMDQMES